MSMTNPTNGFAAQAQGLIAFVLWGVGNFVGSTLAGKSQAYHTLKESQGHDGPRLARHLDLSGLGRAGCIGDFSDFLPRSTEEKPQWTSSQAAKKKTWKRLNALRTRPSRLHL
jgi:hypothetical protein